MDIALMGYGRMGRAVEERAAERGHRIVHRIRSAGDEDGAGLEGADVAVDFSVAAAVPANVARAAGAGLDVVVGTTGWEERAEEVRETVEEAGIGLLHSPNFSMGAQLFYRLASLAGRLSDVLGDYDVHVVETHHRHKRDVPSGTARRLAELLVEAVPSKDRWKVGACGPDEPAALGITSVRAGESAGVHVVGLDGRDDRIEVRHEARGRSGFARGALEAAEWLAGRPGWHTLDDMLAERLERAAWELEEGER